MLDYASDIGGVYSLFQSMIMFLLSIVNYNSVENFMVLNTYRLEVRPGA